jgi:putative acyl-CoA dehydrogenase
MTQGTHEVTNQSEPWTDVNRLGTHQALQDALSFHGERADDPVLTALGAEAGSAALQEQARQADLHKPVLHSHDRFGRRIDEVEFHPTYHALMARALHHGLHGTP